MLMLVIFFTNPDEAGARLPRSHAQGMLLVTCGHRELGPAWKPDLQKTTGERR